MRLYPTDRTLQTLRTTLLAAAVLLAVAAVMLLQRMPRPDSAVWESVPLPFGGRESSFLGALTDIGAKGGKVISVVSFAGGETLETLPVDHLNIILTPDAADISHGARLSDAITAGKRVYGYKYSSRNAGEERAARARADNGEPLTFPELFSGQFFASDADNGASNFVPEFVGKNEITFLPLSAVTLERNARYVIVTADAGTVFTVRGLVICGDGIVSGEEECEPGLDEGCGSVCRYGLGDMVVRINDPGFSIEGTHSTNTFVSERVIAMFWALNGDVHTENIVAEWTFSQLPEGMYEVFLPWISKMRFVPASYELMDGENTIASVQSPIASMTRDATRLWAHAGSYDVHSGRLTVRMTNDIGWDDPAISIVLRAGPVMIRRQICGNAVREGDESCDDGNTQDGDACDVQCGIARCGNGITDPGEQCDDGNTESGDACSGICTAEICGNGVTDATEQCDDGGTENGDGCSALCRLESGQCGDGYLGIGEQCDDGGTENGDGCSGVCTAEACSTIAGTDAKNGIIVTADPDNDGLHDLMVAGPFGDGSMISWFRNAGAFNDHRLGRDTQQIGSHNSMITAMGATNDALFLTDGNSSRAGIMRFGFPFFQTSVRFSSLPLSPVSPDTWVVSAQIDTDDEKETVFCGLHGIRLLDGSETHDPVVALSRMPCKAMLATDTDRDGDSDLVAYEDLGDDIGGIRLYDNDGYGSFRSSRSLVTNDVNPHIIASASGDINGDGILDFAIAENDADAISVVVSDGKGWYLQNDILVGATAVSILIDDFTGDGRADLAYTVHEDRSVLAVVSGNGDGTFAAPRIIPLIEPVVRKIVAGDFNADGSPDIAYIVENGTTRILMNDGRGFLSADSSTCTFAQ